MKQTITTTTKWLTEPQEHLLTILSSSKLCTCNRLLYKFLLFCQPQVSADANDGTVDQVSLSNNGTSVGEERTVACVSIIFLQNNIFLKSSNVFKSYALSYPFHCHSVFNFDTVELLTTTLICISLNRKRNI